jgi:hypothetical protein
MITIWKLELGSWVLVGEFDGTMSELENALNSLRQDENDYRAELKVESFSSILEV